MPKGGTIRPMGTHRLDYMGNDENTGFLEQSVREMVDTPGIKHRRDTFLSAEHEAERGI